MPPIITKIPLSEHRGHGPAPHQWESVPGVEIHLQNADGFAPKDFGIRVDVQNQEGEVIYRVLSNGVPVDHEEHLPSGSGSFERNKVEHGPMFPDQTLTLEWKQLSPGAGLGMGGAIRFGLMNCGWGIP